MLHLSRARLHSGRCGLLFGSSTLVNIFFWKSLSEPVWKHRDETSPKLFIHSPVNERIITTGADAKPVKEKIRIWVVTFRSFWWLGFVFLIICDHWIALSQLHNDWIGCISRIGVIQVCEVLVQIHSFLVRFHFFLQILDDKIVDV